MSQYWQEHVVLRTKSSLRPSGRVQKERRLRSEGEDEATAPAGGVERSTDAEVLQHIKKDG